MYNVHVLYVSLLHMRTSVMASCLCHTLAQVGLEPPTTLCSLDECSSNRAAEAAQLAGMNHSYKSKQSKARQGKVKHLNVRDT